MGVGGVVWRGGVGGVLVLVGGLGEGGVGCALRCCATNRKVVGSIPAGVIGIFH